MFKYLVSLAGAASLLANRNHIGVDAASPVLVKPISTLHVEPGQAFSYDINLNEVFNHADGNFMTFGGVNMTDGSAVPNWLTAGPIAYSGNGQYALDIEVLDGIAHVKNGDFGSLAFNISNPTTNPNITVHFFNFEIPPLVVYGITIDQEEGTAFVADESGWHFFNICNASNVTLLGSHKNPGYVRNFTIQTEGLYMTAHSGFLLGHTLLSGTTPLNAEGNYNFSVYATNANGEWISTNFELIVGKPSPAVDETANSNSRASRLTDTLFSTARLLNVPGLGFLAKDQKKEQQEAVPVQELEHTMKLGY